jgi:hypothetical protein
MKTPAAARSLALRPRLVDELVAAQKELTLGMKNFRPNWRSQITYAFIMAGSGRKTENRRPKTENSSAEALLIGLSLWLHSA